MHPEVQVLIDAWHWSYLDLDASFQGLSEGTLHARPSNRQISIAEIAAHTAYSEASIILRYLLGVPREEWGVSPFLQPPYGWPPDIVDSPAPDWLLKMSAVEVKDHWRSEHERILGRLSDFDLPLDHSFDDAWSDAAPNVETRLRFAAYHVAYHVGQIYAIRSTFGEETADN